MFGKSEFFAARRGKTLYCTASGSPLTKPGRGCTASYFRVTCYVWLQAGNS